MGTAHSLILPAEAGAILFDLDGTLADTDPLHAQAWQEIASTHFGIAFTWSDYYRACIVEGLSPAEFLSRLGADVLTDDINREKAAIFRRLLESQLTLAQGVETFLTLAAKAGITLAIVSSGSRSSVDSFLATLWPGNPPEVSISRDDTGRHKPDPEPYLLALSRLKRHADNCIAVEDTIRGIESARRAGLRNILVSADIIPAPYGADLIVSSLRELALFPMSQGGWIVQKIGTQLT
jgi:HAD superfamily hydrolase (TIGR01509 family)